MKKLTLLTIIGLIAFKINADILFTNVFNFTNTSGTAPRGQLISDNNGNLYGVTQSGGSNAGGTLFKLTESGNFSILHSFALGAFSRRGPTLFSNDIYGVTVCTSNFLGNGVLYRYNILSNIYSELIVFNGTNGINPECVPLVLSNKIYVTTGSGGSSNYGTILCYNLQSSSISWFTNFNKLNGDDCRSGLVYGNDGWIYGVSETGGTFGLGNIFRIRLDGSSLTNIYNFNGSTNGSIAQCELIFNEGYLWGVTKGNTVFKISTNLVFSPIYSFTDEEDGIEPTGICLGQDGSFYGSCAEGGINDNGTIFRLTKDGEFTLIKKLSGNTNEASYPQGLTLAKNGNFYYLSYDQNRIVKISIPMPVFVTKLERIDCNSAKISWNSVGGQKYELISKDNLLTTNYNSLGSITATNSETSLIDTNNILLIPNRNYFVKTLNVPTNNPNYAAILFKQKGYTNLIYNWFTCNGDVTITNDYSGGGTNINPPGF